MADLLFFWILYIVALESGNIWILPVRQPDLLRQLVENHPHQSCKLPGLYVGAAGCGSSLLRAYAVLTGKKLTNLYEYHFLRKCNVLYNMYEEYGNYLTGKY